MAQQIVGRWASGRKVENLVPFGQPGEMRVVIWTDVTSTKRCENRDQKGECERKHPHNPCAKPIAQPIFDAGHRLATGIQTDGSEIKRQCAALGPARYHSKQASIPFQRFNRGGWTTQSQFSIV